MKIGNQCPIGVLIAFLLIFAPLHAEWQNWYVKVINALSSVCTLSGRAELAHNLGLGSSSCEDKLKHIGVDTQKIAQQMRFHAPVVCEFPTKQTQNEYYKDQNGCYHVYIPAGEVTSGRKSELSYRIALSLKRSKDERFGRSFLSLVSNAMEHFFEKRADLIVASCLEDGISIARSYYADYYNKVLLAKKYFGFLPLEKLITRQAENDPAYRPAANALTGSWSKWVRWLQPQVNQTVSEVWEKKGDLQNVTVAERMGYLADFERRRQWMPTFMARWTTMIRSSRPVEPAKWAMPLTRYDDASWSQNGVLETIATLQH